MNKYLTICCPLLLTQYNTQTISVLIVKSTMRRSESSRYIIVIEFEIITSEKYILTVLILTKPNQQPHLTIISPQARCCSVTLSGMRRTEPNPRKRVVRWGDMMEERGGACRQEYLCLAGQCRSVPGRSPLVPTGPRDTNTQIAELCPALRYLHLAYFALLSP